MHDTETLKLECSFPSKFSYSREIIDGQGWRTRAFELLLSLRFAEASISLLLESNNLIPNTYSSPDGFQGLQTLFHAL